jgi:hypothetical protein
VIGRKKIEGGWAGKPEDLFQVLWETRWINPELPRSKYNKAGNKGQDFDENDKVKPKWCTSFLPTSWPLILTWQ